MAFLNRSLYFKTKHKPCYKKNYTTLFPPIIFFMQVEEEISRLNQIENSLKFVMVLLGAAMILFLIYNYRNNSKRRKRRSYLSSNLMESEKDILEYSDPLLLIGDHPIPTAVCNINGIILYANKAFAKVFGTSHSNMKRILLFNVLPVHMSSSLINMIEEKMHDEILTPNGFFSPNTQKRYQLRWKQTAKKKIETGSVLVTLEEMFQVEKINLSEEKSKKLAKDFINNSPLAIFIEDENGIILDVNDAACHLHDLEKEDLIGKTLNQFSPEDFRKEITTKHHLIAENEKITFKSVTFPRKGLPKPIEIQVNKINYYGINALMFVITDLSETIEKKKELNDFKIKAEESDRLKSSFLANLSHEVRTPMNSIMGFAELLAQPGTNKQEREEFITLIRQSGKELLNQINNMIDFSKIEAGLIHLKAEICNIEVLFHDLQDFSEDEIFKSQNIKIFFDLPKDIIKNGIASDKLRLRQILKIFLANSLKYTQNGIIEVGVRIKAPQLYEFYVRDTGIGIPVEKHKQIFEKFRQVDDSQSREFSGMGLGLSIAARLIQFLGGHQWVISEPDKGSEFRFVLPDLIYPQGSPLMQVSCGPTTMLRKIMVVSPSEEVYLDLSNDSKPVNYQVFWAQNAQEMNSMLLSNNIRYILIDLDQLPFWQELLPRIRTVESKIQLVGITQELDMKRKERLKSMGFNEALRAPVNIPILLHMLEKNQLSAMHSLTSSITKN